LRHARLSTDERRCVVTAPRGADQADLDQARTAATEAVHDSGVPHQVQTLERGDDAAEALMSNAEQAEASLIIIGLRRRSPLGKLILGSNAQRILLEAPCPVLAVKPEVA